MKSCRAALQKSLPLLFFVLTAFPAIAAEELTEMQAAKKRDMQQGLEMLDPLTDLAKLTSLRLQGDEQQAATVDAGIYQKLQTILQKDPENFAAWSFLSSMKGQDGADGSAEHQKALAIINQRIAGHPDWAFQYSDRAHVYTDGSEFEKAKADYRQALSLSTDEKEKKLIEDSLVRLDRRIASEKKMNDTMKALNDLRSQAGAVKAP